MINTIAGRMDYWQYVMLCCLEYNLFQKGKIIHSEAPETKTLLFDFLMNEDCEDYPFKLPKDMTKNLRKLKLD